MNIGIFGGTFDPIHNGHLHLAARAQEQFFLDKILFVPTLISPHKTSRGDLTSAQNRCEMVQAAFRDYPDFTLSTIEVERSGISYTVDTLRQIKAEQPDDSLFLILGADASAHFSDWYKPREIQSLATLLIAPREGTDLNGEAPQGASWIKMPVYPYQSSVIRGAVREGRLITGMVPPAVADFIRQKDLYGKG